MVNITLLSIIINDPRNSAEWQVNSMIGSFEKNAAENGAPQRLILASIKVEPFRGDLKYSMPLLCRAW